MNSFFGVLPVGKIKDRSTKSHETARKPNITKEYFGAVSCDLVDRPVFSVSTQKIMATSWRARWLIIAIDPLSYPDLVKSLLMLPRIQRLEAA